MNAADTYQLLGAYAVDALDDTERAEVERYLERDTAIIVGTYDEVAQALSSFAENHGTEEVMLISYIDDVEVRTRQYAELAARLL